MPRKLEVKNRLVCTCPVSYRVEGRRFVCDGELPTVMEMCYGRCERCGLPYHTEFSGDE